MAQMTDWLEAELRKHCFRSGSFTKPTTITIRLFTAAPGEAGGGTEVAGGVGYVAPTLNPDDANWTADSATDGLTDNASVVSFGTPTGSWGQVTHVALDFDANRALYGTLAAPKNVTSGDPAPNFPIGTLDVVFA